ncbi:MAG: peptidase [Actinomycetes bacterium]
MSDFIMASPFHRGDHSLAGFVVSGRWPNTTREWAQFLALAVRMAATPGMVVSSALFRAVEDLPENPPPDSVGIVTCEGWVLAADGPRPGQFAHPQPPALFVLHPPRETPQHRNQSGPVASGCVLLPGLPHLGLEHRAAWVAAESDGTIAHLISIDGVNTLADPDLAVLASYLAA